jgi:hypothetical protein
MKHLVIINLLTNRNKGQSFLQDFFNLTRKVSAMQNARLLIFTGLSLAFSTSVVAQTPPPQGVQRLNLVFTGTVTATPDQAIAMNDPALNRLRTDPYAAVTGTPITITMNGAYNFAGVTATNGLYRLRGVGSFNAAADVSGQYAITSISVGSIGANGATFFPGGGFDLVYDSNVGAFSIDFGADNFFNMNGLVLPAYQLDANLSSISLSRQTRNGTIEGDAQGRFTSTTATFAYFGPLGLNGQMPVFDSNPLFGRPVGTAGPFVVTGSFNLPTFGTTSVPEPSTIAILGLGVIGLGVARRRTRNAVN